MAEEIPLPKSQRQMKSCCRSDVDIRAKTAKQRLLEHCPQFEGIFCHPAT